jgi:4-diphosphocytidyl-2-C-methyl-D-erythritol kinase
MTLRAEAFAKVNRRLHVISRRADGFHEIDTLFQTIDLADRISVEPGGAGIEIECDDPSVPADSRNLVSRAGHALAEAFGLRAAARVTLEKRIPAGGGLGGGSSDAAVALGLFARLWRIPATAPDLHRIGAGLGSDVPYFFHGGAARGRGRGDRIELEPDIPETTLLVVIPPLSISTASVYSLCRPGGPDAEATGRQAAFFGRNDLASAVLDLEPAMKGYFQTVSEELPDAQISGSGATIVARPSPSGIDEAKVRLAKRIPGARILAARTVARPEYRRRSMLDFSQEVTPP